MTDRIKTYDELVAAYPIIDLLKGNTDDGLLVAVYLLGRSDGIDRALEVISERRETARTNGDH